MVQVLRHSRGLPLIVLLCCVILDSNARADTLAGRVVYVADGDSITVREDNGALRRIRLSGIDAPELGQAYSGRSKQHLSTLLHDKLVRVTITKWDDHGRIVGKVMVASPDACRDRSDDCPKTLDAGLSQLTVGLAWWYRYYAAEQSEQDRHRYEFAEFEARSRKAGLWQDENPVQPWQWRRDNKPRSD